MHLLFSSLLFSSQTTSYQCPTFCRVVEERRKLLSNVVELERLYKGMVRKNKRRKEDIAEDWCFVCKDGGLLMVCDYRDCLKAYHPHCVDKDDSFLENGNSHFCSLCRKASKFKCFCCPKAVCGNCIYNAEFATVKGNRGFCSHCSKLALLIEENADIDSDGEEVDFKDRDTYECLFSEYYEIIKEEEGLNSQHVYSADRFFKNGKNKRVFDPDEIGEGEDDTGDSEDVSNFIVSDSDDLNDTAGSKSVRKKKGMIKLKSIKGKVKDKKKEFIGWGSRSLIEFLEYIGKDTSKEFSEHDVTSIIIEYCRDNNLFDPKKKRKILCDAQLRPLLGRKSVNRNSIQNLLAPHFAENFEEMDDISSGSEERDYNEPLNFSRKRKSITSTESHHPNLVSEECQSCFAAIVSSNLKLVYLKRSLVDELSKQPEAFDGKVLGSFVRVKSDPHDYLQKNSHLLVQVIGINRSLKNDEINKEIMLRLSNVPKDVPICKISDDDFSEEECQDLYQRMRNGLLKQPTILELEQKARSLHEDIIKHWIPRKLVLLQNRIDQANEKGWRREYPFNYMDQKLKLETPLEQSRLLNEIPKVIPEIVNTNLSPEGSPRKDKLEQNGLSELAASGKTCNSVGHNFKQSGFAHCLNLRTDVAVETLAQDVENDKGVPTLGSSQTGGEKPQSNKELRVYTRRNLQKKKVQPIIPTQQIDSLEISPENFPAVMDKRNALKRNGTSDIVDFPNDKIQGKTSGERVLLKPMELIVKKHLLQCLELTLEVYTDANWAGSIIHRSSTSGPISPVEENQDGTAFPVASVEQLSVNTASQDKGTSQRKLHQSTSKALQDDPEGTLSEELSNSAKYGLCQPRNIESGSVKKNGRNLSATGYAKQTIKEKQSISVVSVIDKQDASILAIPGEEQECSISTTNVIVLSDDDEQKANVADILAGRKAVENPEISIWHCVGPYGEKGGPYSMSVLKRWSESASYPLEFKVWKTGQSETEAIPLTDVLDRIFSGVGKWK
ncbi:hypothetical protein CR513_46825, partial [Mucuna pruriens]